MFNGKKVGWQTVFKIGALAFAIVVGIFALLNNDNNVGTASMSGNYYFTETRAPAELFLDGMCSYEIFSRSGNPVGSGQWQRCGGYKWGQLNGEDILFTTDADLSIGVHFTVDPFGLGFVYSSWNNLVGRCPALFGINLQSLLEENNTEYSCN